jgi:uncharacterized membrane protein
MSRVLSFFRATLLGGLILIAPLVVSALLIRESFRLAAAILAPVAQLIPAENVGGVVVADLLAATAILAACFVAGLFVATRLGRFLSERLETLALRRVPGFSLLRGATRGMVGLETQSDLSVALARIEDAWMMAFVVERHSSGLFTVFVPSAPTPAAGSVYFLTEDRIRVLNVPVSAAVTSIMSLGHGSRDLLERAGCTNLHMPPPKATIS